MTDSHFYHSNLNIHELQVGELAYDAFEFDKGFRLDSTISTSRVWTLGIELLI